MRLSWNVGVAWRWGEGCCPIPCTPAPMSARSSPPLAQVLPSQSNIASHGRIQALGGADKPPASCLVLLQSSVLMT